MKLLNKAILLILMCVFSLSSYGKKTPFLFDETSLDILFVVDNSGSMGSYQKELGKNFKKFISEIHFDRYIDYRIGVMNSDKNFAGKLITGTHLNPFVEKKDIISDPRHYIDLTSRLTVGVTGSSEEVFFLPIRKLMEGHLFPEKNNFYDFFRQDAYLAIIIVTDEMDQSYKQESSKSVSEMVDIVHSFKSHRVEKVLTFGIVQIYQESDDCGSAYEDIKSNNIRQFVKMTKGYEFSLCDDFASTLSSIGSIIKNRVSLPR